MNATKDLDHQLAAVLFDLGDTLMIEETEIKTPDGTTVYAELLPGAKKLLRHLKEQQLTVGMVTDSVPKTPINVLEQHDLFDFFETVMISDVIGSSKHEPYIFRATLAALGIPEEEMGRVMMVGNNLETDVAGANRLGMISVYFGWNDRRRTEPISEDEKPDYTVSSLDEMLCLIETLDRGEEWPG